MRRRSGGRCYGQTCERDFRFTWQCLNHTVHRWGMLAGERDDDSNMRAYAEVEHRAEPTLVPAKAGVNKSQVRE